MSLLHPQITILSALYLYIWFTPSNVSAQGDIEWAAIGVTHMQKAIYQDMDREGRKRGYLKQRTISAYVKRNAAKSRNKMGIVEVDKKQ